MIFKEIPQIDCLKYIAKNHIAKDEKLIKSIIKLNIYVLHTLNEDYYLKGNEKDLKGNLFAWTDKAKGGYGTMRANRWLAAFEGDNIVGVQMFRLCKGVKMMWDGFIHCDTKEIAIALNKELFKYTKGEWDINYSEHSEETELLLTMEDMEQTLGYKCWANCQMPNHYAYYAINTQKSLDPDPNTFDKYELKRYDNRRNFLKRLPDAFDEDK